MSSSVSLVSLKNIYNLWVKCLATYSFLFLKVLPIGSLSTSICSTASSECVLAVSGGCASFDGRWRLSITGGLTLSIDGGISFPIDVDINKAGWMWVSFYELLVSHDPHDIARNGRLCSCRRSMLWRGCRLVLVEVLRSMFKVWCRSTPMRSAEAHRTLYFEISFLQLRMLHTLARNHHL
ncbi:hypothetical protein F2Q68_00016609 [Brassica cretica]|uniref:Uncharacterized protein n=1 Tax=Brassica cretica TaxID=69181 RepID=A0A8S9HFD3_BRACR|nr:hypothetical protein F2Q68_00016609 [Brassica cretica]